MNAVEYIHSLRTFGKKAGLNNIEALLSRLANPHKDMNFIHVAGTNGKGSVSSMLNSIFIAKDKKVGLFTSPFIESFNERICINNIPIPDADLERITDRIKPVVAELEKEDIFCTVFDVICAVGFTYFSEQRCDIVVLEVGLGGRFDATNIIESPLCSVICAIGYDHMQYLGDTLDKIAFEKCGIVKNDCPTVSYPLQNDDAKTVIESTCISRKSPLITPDVSQLEIVCCDINGSEFVYKDREYRINLVGEYQIYNSLCAIETAYLCGATYDDVCVGLASAKWKCRFEVFQSDDKIIVLDGAHNSHGISGFLRSAEKFFADKRIHYVFSILNEKDIDDSCDMMSAVNGDITVTSVPSERCTDPMAVFEKIRAKHTDTTYIADNDKALDNAVSSDCDVVCVLGSLYTVGAMRKYVEKFLSNRQK